MNFRSWLRSTMTVDLILLLTFAAILTAATLWRGHSKVGGTGSGPDEPLDVPTQHKNEMQRGQKLDADGALTQAVLDGRRRALLALARHEQNLLYAAREIRNLTRAIPASVDGLRRLYGKMVSDEELYCRYAIDAARADVTLGFEAAAVDRLEDELRDRLRAGTLTFPDE